MGLRPKPLIISEKQQKEVANMEITIAELVANPQLLETAF